MKRLVIHPNDASTAFLTKVYENLDGVTLVQGDVTGAEIKRLIATHDQVMMMGHGSAFGLMSVGQFPDAPGHVIDDSFAPLLAEKDDSVFIWCNADEYVHRNRLKGFYTGMFISEVDEAYLMGIGETTQSEVDESNDLFVQAVGGLSACGPRLMHAAARHKYGHLARSNRIAKYNHERLFLSDGAQ